MSRIIIAVKGLRFGFAIIYFGSIINIAIRYSQFG